MQQKWMIPVVLVFANLDYALFAGAQSSVILWIIVYFAAAPLILFAGKGKTDRPDLYDAGALLWMALILISKGKRFGGTVDLPLVVFSAVAEGLWLWKGYRGMTGITFLKRPSWRDFFYSLATLAVLWFSLLGLALWLGFPEPIAVLAKDHSLKNILALTFAGITKAGFVTYLMRKALITALVEELLYRGIILNFLEKLFGPKVALAASSLLFGLSHIGHGGWRYGALSALAGVGFGKTYQQTRCLSLSMGVHASLDTFARILFRF